MDFPEEKFKNVVYIRKIGAGCQGFVHRGKVGSVFLCDSVNGDPDFVLFDPVSGDGFDGEAELSVGKGKFKRKGSIWKELGGLSGHNHG